MLFALFLLLLGALLRGRPGGGEARNRREIQVGRRASVSKFAAEQDGGLAFGVSRVYRTPPPFPARAV